MRVSTSCRRPSRSRRPRPGTPHSSGTLTFLFTNIEGSTRLWEQHPEAMPQALADALASDEGDFVGSAALLNQAAARRMAFPD